MKKNTELLQKLELETANTGVVHLWLEGMFWKAYERSAYVFVQRISGYKPYKRFVHAAGGEVLAIGFPARAFTKVTDGRVLEQVTDKHCVMSGFTLERNELKGYYEWKNQVPSFPYTVVSPAAIPAAAVPTAALAPVAPARPRRPVAAAAPAAPAAPAAAPAPERTAEAPDTLVVAELRRFRMESATPLDCMMFLSRLITIADRGSEK